MKKESIEVPYSAGREVPKEDIPLGAIDSHCHIFDPVRFPYKPDDVRNQPPATVDCYKLLQRRLGIDRCVVVTPSCYGTDNSCTLDALQQFGNNARGIAVVDDNISPEIIHLMDKQGIRGVRFNVVSGASDDINRIIRIAYMIAPIRWTISLWMTADKIIQYEKELEQLPCKLVFDHRGHIPSDEGISNEAFSFITHLMKLDKAYVKLSALYHDSVKENYADTVNVSLAYINADHDHVVWGTDWPHHSEVINHRSTPNDAYMMDVLLEKVKDSMSKKKLLVENPQKAFGFDRIFIPQEEYEL